MNDSIFTKIIKGEIPSYKIYEDNKTLAFLDIYPLMPGHTLVVTKKQVDQYIDLPDEDYLALWMTVKKVAAHLKRALNVDRIKLGVVGTDVPHVHVHLTPFNEDQKPPDHYDGPSEPDHAALAEMAKKLAF
jgi:histidine triad (HIT) family protein